jgi:hypothetical protein
MESGGSYTGDFERYVNVGSSNGPSLSGGIHEGDLEGGILYWGPQKICKLRLWKWVSTSKRCATFREHGGALLS